MSKKTASDSVADQIATFIGKSMGELVNKKESLQTAAGGGRKQIAGVRNKVLRAVRRRRPSPAPGQAGREARGQSGRRELSPATRRKMAASAKKRWARARQAAKDDTGA